MVEIPNQDLGKLSNQYKWKGNLFQYKDSELRAVTFHSDGDLEKALKLLWTDKELYGVPRDVIGDRTMVLPAEALPYLRGVSYTSNEILSMGDLSPQERRELRLRPYD